MLMGETGKARVVTFTLLMTTRERDTPSATAAALGHRGTRTVEEFYDLTDVEVYMAEWQRILAEDLGE